MTIMRFDVIENQRLSEIFDWEKWSFEDMQWVIYDFVNDLISGSKLTDMSISPVVVDFISKNNNMLYRFLIGEIDSKEINSIKTDHGSFLEDLSVNERLLLEAIKIGITDAKRACFPMYDAGFQFGTMISSLYLMLDGDLYRKFAEFIECHPRAKKYKYPI